MTDPHTRTQVTIRGPEGIVRVMVVPSGPADVDQGAIQDAFLARLMGEDPSEDESASTRHQGAD